PWHLGLGAGTGRPRNGRRRRRPVLRGPGVDRTVGSGARLPPGALGGRLVVRSRKRDGTATGRGHLRARAGDEEQGGDADDEARRTSHGGQAHVVSIAPSRVFGPLISTPSTRETTTLKTGRSTATRVE